MADEAKPENLTLWGALKDLGWLPLAFTVIVGAPSILAILESVFVNHQLAPALQWIVDGYNRVMAVVGAVVEPLVQPAIDWVNARLNWSLTLDPVWRPAFALGMVFALAYMRTGLREGSVGDALVSAALTLGFLTAALLTGLLAAGPGWLAQGAVAAVPVAMCGLVLAALDASSGDWRSARDAAVFFGGLAVFSFAISAGLSFVPGLAQGGGLLVWGGLIALFGVGFALLGLSKGNRVSTRVGLTMLGGFVAAGLILVADWGLKALGAG